MRTPTRQWWWSTCVRRRIPPVGSDAREGSLNGKIIQCTQWSASALAADPLPLSLTHSLHSHMILRDDDPIRDERAFDEVERDTQVAMGYGSGTWQAPMPSVGPGMVHWVLYSLGDSTLAG